MVEIGMHPGFVGREPELRELFQDAPEFEALPRIDAP